ncbi:hypothetical protein GQX74_008258 [Glossina fuscipes]|nr:hypothetical protein GQX74_008258 [Glossina fuscipes]
MPTLHSLWPEMPHIILKVISCGLFCGSIFFEVTDMQALKSVFNSSCIVGNEITEEVGHHWLLLFMVMIPDCVYAATILLAIPVRNCNFGSEPTTIVYNILAGLIAHSSLSKVTLIKDCGNQAMEVILLQPAATVSLVGTLHYANAFLSVVFLARVESHIN